MRENGNDPPLSETMPRTLPEKIPPEPVTNAPERAPESAPDGGAGRARTRVLRLEGPGATTRLATAIAPHLGPGDTIALTGDLGAGKSHFARGVIAARLAAEGRSEDIPSPTYTLVQTYETGGAEIWHADLYRLGDISEIAELGLEDAFGTAIVLVEWAGRLGPHAPARRLDLHLAGDAAAPDARSATLAASGPGWDWLDGMLAAAFPGAAP